MSGDRTDIHPLVQAGLDHISQGITIFDRDLRLVAWNRHFIDLLEFPRDLAFAGADFESFIRHNAEKGEYGPGDPEALIARRVEDARRFVPHSFERTRPDGTIIRVVGRPLPEGGFVTLYTDVTAQKEHEAALEERVEAQTEALRRSEARLRLIANELPAGIAHVDRDMRFLYANRRFARAYGYSPEDILGLRCARVLAPETLAASSHFFEQARRGAVVDFEISVAFPDGRRKDVRTFLRPEQPSEGEVIGFYILSVDVTRQKQVTAALLQSQKMDALGRLSSGISHDFNNLLTVIIGNLLPLRDRIQDRELREEYVDPAIAAARRGSDLTRRLLTLARRQPLDPQPLYVEDAIGDLVKILRSSIPDTIEIVASARGQAQPAFVDPAQFEMALLNLAVNARDAISGSGQIRIASDHVQLDPEEAEALKIASGAYVRVVVEDNGAGIPADRRERIFEPFFTSKAEGGGSGLGLSMVYGFVKQSNGVIRVDSDPGVGSRFTLLLPVAREVAPRRLPDRRPDVPLLPVEPGRIALLVDDNDEVRSVLRRQLVDLGYPLVEAGSAAEAIELLDGIADIGVVVSDIAMPGEMSGIDLGLHVRAVAPDVAVVLMTGHGGAVEAAAAGADFPVLRKPFEPADLAAAIRAELHRGGSDGKARRA